MTAFPVRKPPTLDQVRIAGPVRYGFHGGTLEQAEGRHLFVAHDPDLAFDYARDAESEVPVYLLEYAGEKPLILSTPEIFVEAWDRAGMNELRFKRWHPEATGHFAEFWRNQGYDSIVIPHSAFEGELGFERVAGSFGEPQSIWLDMEKVIGQWPVDARSWDTVDSSLNALRGSVGRERG